MLLLSLLASAQVALLFPLLFFGLHPSLNLYKQWLSQCHLLLRQLQLFALRQRVAKLLLWGAPGMQLAMALRLQNVLARE